MPVHEHTAVAYEHAIIVLVGSRVDAQHIAPEPPIAVACALRRSAEQADVAYASHAMACSLDKSVRYIAVNGARLGAGHFAGFITTSPFSSSITSGDVKAPLRATGRHVEP